jgi:GT2 family glycosyltransferase
MESQIQVSVVIVCMNNLHNLYPCLQSIKKETKINYEVLVVAYLFSDENLAVAKKDFPWVRFIRNDKISGFSENNNLALKYAQGKYCFVLNDDTEMFMPVIDRLVQSIEKLPEDVAIISPTFLNADGSVQACGNAEKNRITYFKSFYGLEKKGKSKYVNQRGVFLTKQILGAGFLIKTGLFRQIGFFDERYFFSPEDLEVARQIQRAGYKCYVDADVFLTHYEGMTSRSLSMVSTATKPASTIGNIIYYGDGSLFWSFVIRVHQFFGSVMRCVYHKLLSIGRKKPNYHYVWSIGYFNASVACLSFRTPKEIFLKYYNKVSK